MTLHEWLNENDPERKGITIVIALILAGIAAVIFVGVRWLAMELVGV